MACHKAGELKRKEEEKKRVAKGHCEERLRRVVRTQNHLILLVLPSLPFHVLLYVLIHILINAHILQLFLILTQLNQLLYFR